MLFEGEAMKRPYTQPAIKATFKHDEGWYCSGCIVAGFDLVIPDEPAMMKHIAEHKLNRVRGCK